MFDKEHPIYTKTKNRAPAKYGSDAIIENSLISDGCVIEGTVINSVLSRGVTVEKGAIVKNSIIMQDAVICKDAYLNHVIFDKEVKVSEGRKLIGQDSYPVAIEKSGKI
jgi:glucose-1-phosphate adenylyltransferase